MSALLAAIVEVLNRRKGKVLDLAQLSMHEAQFRTFKKLFQVNSAVMERNGSCKRWWPNTSVNGTAGIEMQGRRCAMRERTPISNG